LSPPRIRFQARHPAGWLQAFTSSHARTQTSRSSSAVKITGIAFE